MSEDPTKYQTEAEAETLALAKIEPDIPMPVSEIKTPQQMRTVEVSQALEPAYQKASTLELTDSEVTKLTAPFRDEEVEIRPHDGLIYLPHILISNRLNKVFGPGKWALLRRREWMDENTNTIYGEYVLLIRGCYVGESVGGHPYIPNNPKTNYSDALESTAGEALRRICGKRLSCGDQVWQPEYARQWTAKYSEQRNGKFYRKSTIATVPAAPVPTPAPRSSSPAPAPKPEKKLAPGEELREWLQRCKEKFLNQASACLLPAWEYAIQEGWILETERLDAVNLSKLFPGIDWGGTVESNTPIVKAVMEQAWAGIQKIADSPENPEMKKKCLLAYAEKEIDNPPADEAPATIEDNYPKITGQIVAVTTKTGTGKKGPWTLYGVKIADAWYNTFDKKLGLLAQDNKGCQVTLTYEEGPRGNNVTNIQPL